MEEAHKYLVSLCHYDEMLLLYKWFLKLCVDTYIVVNFVQVKKNFLLVYYIIIQAVWNQFLTIFFLAE